METEIDNAALDLEKKRALLIRAAELLHRYGTPSHRLEGVMKRVSRSLGIEADFLYTPTSLFVSFQHEERRAQLMRVDAGPIELGKLAEFDEALERLERRQCTLDESAAEFRQIETAPHRFPEWLVAVSTAVASACATTFLGGGWAELAIAAMLGFLVHGLGLWLNWLAPGERLLEVLAAFGCAILSLLVSRFIFPLDDRVATLGSLIVLLPGLSVTIAMTELANRHLSSGVSRLAGAGVVFLTLAVGVALAWRLCAFFKPAGGTATALPGFGKDLAVFIAPFCFIVLFQARIQDWLQICSVAWLGFLAADFSQQAYGAEWGAFLGASVIGLLSNIYARRYNRPSLIPQIPAILMLVPGSLGYLSVAAFIDRQGVQGVETAFTMSIVAVALAGGLITANVVCAPKRFL